MPGLLLGFTGLQMPAASGRPQLFNVGNCYSRIRALPRSLVQQNAPSNRGIQRLNRPRAGNRDPRIRMLQQLRRKPASLVPDKQRYRARKLALSR